MGGGGGGGVVVLIFKPMGCVGWEELKWGVWFLSVNLWVVWGG